MSTMIMLMLIAAAGNLRSEVLEQVQQSLVGVDTISGVCEIISEPSPYYVTLRATHGNVTYNNMYNRLYSHSIITFCETRSGLFRSDIKRTGIEKNTSGTVIYCWDGKEAWILKYPGTTTGDLPPEVTFGSPVREKYEAEVSVKRLLGISLLPADERIPFQGRSLKDRLAEEPTTEVIENELVDGVRCARLTWYKSRGAGNTSKETFWLDADRGNAIRKYQEEINQPGGSGWSLMTGWTSNDLAKTEAANSKPPHVFWYPKVTQVKTYDASGNPYFIKTITIKQLTFNKPVDVRGFTPVIEDGTNLVDARKGVVTVYGNGPSQRLRSLIAKRVSESKQKLDAIDVGGDVPAVSLASNVEQYGHWVALGLGTVGLVLAVGMRARRRSGTPDRIDP